MQKSYLALDLGGTKLLVGEVAADGTIIASKSYPTGPIDQQRAAEVIFASVDDYLTTVGIKNPDGVSAIGIGLVGRIDSPAGLWCQIDSLRTAPLPLAAMVGERYALPCYIDNDVKCATRAEQLFGIGRSTRDFIYINIGTGKEITIAALAQLIVEEVGFKGKLTFDSTKPDGTMRKLTDVSKLHALGWHHQIEIEEGVHRMYQWYLS